MIRELAEKLGGAQALSANRWVCQCPAHPDRSPSLVIWEHHGKLGFTCYAGCTTEEVYAKLKELGFEHEVEADALPKHLRLLKHSIEITDTPASAYLKKRGLTESVPHQVVRYLPEAYFQDQVSYGAIVFAGTGADGGPQCLHLVYLDKDGNKAPLKVKKRTIGSISGASLTLPGTGPVVVCEGPEDALSIWQATGRQVHATFGINFDKLPLGAGSQVVIARDNDPAGAASRAKTDRILKRMYKRGIIVLDAEPTSLPDQEKTDFNDILKALGPAEVLAQIDAAKPYTPPTKELTATENDEGEVLSYMNQRYAVVVEQGKTLVIEEEMDEEAKRLVLVRTTFADLRNLYCNKTIVSTASGAPKLTSLGEFWLSHPQRRTYEKLVFEPGKQLPAKYYNLWRGWNVEAQPGEWTLFKRHLFDNVCNQNQALYQYLYRWMARAVQELEAPNEVAIVLRGKRGTGKGTLVKILGKLFGQHYLHISNSKHLTGSFNAHLRDALLVFADEAFWAGDKQGESTLKTLITEPELVIERKGKDVLQEKNRIKLIIASNSDWVVPAGLEERRFAAFDVKDTEMQNASYFQKIFEQMEAGGYEGLLYDLLQEDLSGFEVRDMPKTDALLDQKLQSLDAVQKWWLEKLEDGRMLDTDADWPIKVYKHRAHEQMMTWMKLNGFNRPVTRDDMLRRLKRLMPVIEESVDDVGRYWVLPDLRECREFFARGIHQTLTWSEPMNKKTPVESPGSAY